MKKLVVAVLFVAVCVFVSHAEISSEDLIDAVDQMTPEEAHDFTQKLEAKLWKPVPEGFFSRMAVALDVGISSFDEVDLSTVAMTAGEMDVDTVSGTAVTILWRLLNERARGGIRFGSWLSEDSDLGPAGYSRAEIQEGHVSVALNYQWIRTDRWLLWTETNLGAGSISLETIDTPTGDSTTLRSFDGEFWLVDLRTGGSLRLNPVLSMFVSWGYCLAEDVDLEEGGSETPVSVDVSGYSGQLGLGINF